VLGQFAERDLFIGLTWSDRLVLKGYQSQEWKRVIRNCKAKWRGFFDPFKPLTAENEVDYVSNIII
jgi:hypothetical protein